MANTSYGVNHPLAIKHWARRLFREALKATYINKFISSSSKSIVHLRTETEKDAGDRIRIGLRMQLSGRGVTGDSTLEGNEEALSTYNDDVYIDQLRHAVRSAGKMSEQRVPFSVRDEARSGLTDWWADRMDQAFFYQLCGYTAESDIAYTGMQATIAASSDRILRPSGVSADQSLSTTDLMNLTKIDYAVEMAKVSTPLMRPIMINGAQHWVMFLHPYQVTDLRTNTSTGQWLDIQKAAMSGGKVSDNPIFNGALGMYNNVVLHEATRVPAGINGSTGAAVSNTRRAVLCGAQAALLAFGQESGGSEAYSWQEELFDYGNQLGVSAGAIWGLKKTQFNSVDFGTIVVPTYAAAHT